MKKSILFLMLMLLTVSMALAQTRLVKGRVVASDSKEAIIQANVIVKDNPTLGTVTDLNGNFQLRVPKGTKAISVSYVGFTTKLVNLIPESSPQSKEDLIIILAPDSKLVDEVVVVGYGSGRRVASIASSVAVVRAKDLEARPVANAFDALQGKVAGLQIATSSGEPSQMAAVKLHGTGSLGANSTPLYILDGMPVGAGTIRTLNNEDLESIQVLKDAAATSIYGARAANGVIVLTSKKGKSGERANVVVRAQYGVSNLANRDYFNGMMNREQLHRFWTDTGLRTPENIKKMYQRYTADTRWDRYYYQDDRPTVQLSAAINGGRGRTSYYISAASSTQDGLMYRSAYSKNSYRLNLNTALNDYISIGTSTILTKDKSQSNPYSGANPNGGLSYLNLPIYSPVDENGNEYYETLIPGVGRYSPKYLADHLIAEGQNLIVNSTSFAQIRPFEGLLLRFQLGYETGDYRYSSSRRPSFLNTKGNGTAREEFQRSTNLVSSNTIEYKFTLKNDHNFIALLGHEFTNYRSGAFSAWGEGLSNDRLVDLGLTTKEKGVDSSTSTYAFLSYFGRLSYDYQGKYFLDLTYRRDASSRFSRHNRWANFWAVGTMWDAKKEAFLADKSWLNGLRLKFSLGTQGNSSIGNYSVDTYVSKWGQSAGEFGWGITSLGNAALTWENQFKTSFGIEAKLFNKLSLELSLYHRMTSSMLMSVPYPYYTGISSSTENVGKLQNRGIDARIEYDIIRNSQRDGISVYANFNYNQDKVVELFQGLNEWTRPNSGVTYAVGQPVSYSYPIQKGVNPQTGRLEWYKPGEAKSITTKNEVVDTFSSNLEQNTGIRRYTPITGGFGLSADYKGLYLQADFAFALGKHMLANDSYFTKNPHRFGANSNQHVDVFDYWKKPGDVATFPSLTSGQDFTYIDSKLLSKADFLRLKTLTLGYALPKKLLSKQNILKGAKLYLTARNLLTWTSFDGPDPEAETNTTLGANPNTKQLTLGVEISF